MFQINDRVRIKRDANFKVINHHFAVRLRAFRDARTEAQIVSIMDTEEGRACHIYFDENDHYWLRPEQLEPAEADHTRRAAGQATLIDALERWGKERPSRAEREVALADKAEALKQEYDRLLDEWGELDYFSKESDAVDDQLDLVREAVIDLLPAIIKTLRFSTETRVRNSIQDRINQVEVVLIEVTKSGNANAIVKHAARISGLRAALRILDEATHAK